MFDDITAAGNTNYKLLTFSWDIIDVCNYNCSYCSAKSFNKHTFKKIKDKKVIWQNVVKTLSLKKIKTPFTVELLGGEPTLHPDIYEIVKQLCSIKNCIQVEITTNLSKSVDFFKQFDKQETNKVDIIASYHPEYFTSKFVDKIIELDKCKHLTITPLINLFHEKKYWQPTLDLTNTFKKYKINFAGNLLHQFEGNDFIPEYTQEFWDIFEPIFFNKPLNESVNISESNELTDENIDKFFNEKLLNYNDNFLINHRKLIKEEKLKNNNSVIINRARWFRGNDNSTTKLLTDADIYKNKFYEYTGWDCRPLMWKINMNGTIENSCTGKMIPLINVNNDKLTSCVTCPVKYCDCNTKYQYVKRKKQ